MKLLQSGEQQVQHYLYVADGTITAGSTAQLVLPRSQSRSMFYFQNLSGTATMNLEVGYGTATATLTSNAVSSIAVNNAGFGYTKPPRILLLGGGYPQGSSGRSQGPNTSYLGLGQPNAPSPPDVATAVATLSGGAISAITVNYKGSQYIKAPYVQIISDDLDPYGCAVPSATSGILLGPGQSLYWNGTACPTDPIGVFSTTTSAPYTCRWMS